MILLSFQPDPAAEALAYIGRPLIVGGPDRQRLGELLRYRGGFSCRGGSAAPGSGDGSGPVSSPALPVHAPLAFVSSRAITSPIDALSPFSLILRPACRIPVPVFPCSLYRFRAAASFHFGYRIALAFEPFADRDFGDRLTDVGNLDFYAHGAPSCRRVECLPGLMNALLQTLRR